MLPHHPQTDPAELEEASRRPPREPALPHHRFFRARGWNLPIPEILLLVVGLAGQQLYPDMTSSLNRLALNAETAGESALIVGIPLLFVPLRVFWFDIAYIVAGLAMCSYMMTNFSGEPIIFLGLVLIVGVGMVLGGVSCLVRRAVAYRFARRRVKK